ncbi:hypothetical protein MKW92_027323 [Papaver armeniacum]|nr:hypothetical protein MKW92_027323 [Papaver armeniacum]
MAVMNITQPPQIGCGGEDISTTTTMTAIEMKRKRAYKRKDCGGDTTNTSTAMKERKDCGDTNTSTVREKKKRPYKRKDCGDANTSTVTEKNKRPYKRKDCGDTNTSTVTKKKKRAYTRKDCIGTNTPTVMEKKKRPYRRKKYLPHDLVMKEILTKLPVPTLLKSVLVSKLWYNSIHNDHKRLTYSHFLQSQKQPNVIFSLLNVRDCDVVKKTGKPRYGSYFFKFTAGMYDRENENALQFDKFRGGNVGRAICEMVGYCRGLPCIAAADEQSTDYIILDPNRKDFLHIFSDFFGAGACIICHGFGFDHSANVYKLVSIFRTIEKELNIMVFTLGTKSWRNVTATTTPISGRPITKIRAPTGSDKSAIFGNTSSSSGSGCLVWKIITTLGGAGSDDIQHDNSNIVNDSEVEMLLSFNLHDEKFQFIQLPAKSTTDEQQKHLHVDYPHLLEFKGSPCIARVEKYQGMEVIILIVAVMIIRVVVVVAAVVVKFICTY